MTVPSTGVVVAPLPWSSPAHVGGGLAVLDHGDEPRATAAWLDAAEAALPPVAPAFARYPWLATVLPAPAVIRRVAEVAAAARAGAAWFYAWWRGDDLYADAAWLLGVGAARALVVRETALAFAPGSHRFDAAGRARPWRGAPLIAAMRHVGVVTRRQYLDPP
jgi:hypothetical protein